MTDETTKNSALDAIRAAKEAKAGGATPASVADIARRLKKGTQEAKAEEESLKNDYSAVLSDKGFKADLQKAAREMLNVMDQLEMDIETGKIQPTIPEKDEVPELDGYRALSDDD